MTHGNEGDVEQLRSEVVQLRTIVGKVGVAAARGYVADESSAVRQLLANPSDVNRMVEIVRDAHWMRRELDRRQNGAGVAGPTHHGVIRAGPSPKRRVERRSASTPTPPPRFTA